jgi:hypothetical protein
MIEHREDPRVRLADVCERERIDVNHRLPRQQSLTTANAEVSAEEPSIFSKKDKRADLFPVPMVYDLRSLVLREVVAVG